MRSILLSLLGFAPVGCAQSSGPPLPEVWKPIDAGIGMWIRHGPIEMSVESVRLGPVKLHSASGTTETPAFVVTTRVRYCGDRHVDSVSLLPLQPSGPTPGRGAVVLEDESGRRYAPLEGFESFVGRRTLEVRLDAEKSEATDELVFDPAAANVDVLIMTLPSLCRARDDAGRDTLQPLDRPPFRFRLLQWMWSGTSVTP